MPTIEAGTRLRSGVTTDAGRVLRKNAIAKTNHAIITETNTINGRLSNICAIKWTELPLFCRPNGRFDRPFNIGADLGGKPDKPFDQLAFAVKNKRLRDRVVGPHQ